jgi:hypothetical protein
VTGGRAAGENSGELFYRKDENAYVYALNEEQGLPPGLVTLSVRVVDLFGHEAARQVTFNVSVFSAAPPEAAFTAEPLAGAAPLEVRFSSAASTDTDGRILRREWYFEDGREAIGPEVTHRFDAPGSYEVALLVRDNEGGVSRAVKTVTVSAGPIASFRRGDSNCDGSADISDAIHELNWLFLGGPFPCCLEAADLDDDAEIDVSDAVFLLFWRFDGAEPPPAPGPLECGPDPQPGAGLGCEAYPEGRC